jgi:hypothetical protein
MRAAYYEASSSPALEVSRRATSQRSRPFPGPTRLDDPLALGARGA